MSNCISRRQLIINASKGLAGAVLLASPLQGQYITVGQQLIDGSAGRGTKALFLPPAASTDPAVHSLAENLFWLDIIGEHAALIGMMMPAPEHAMRRAEADQFRRSFGAQYERARTITLDRTTFAALNRSSVDLIKPFIEWERTLFEEQKVGKVRTMIWPTFYEHTIHEAQRAILRLETLTAGTVAVDGKDVIGFWSGMMSDHGDFVAHLLDPKEADLISTALDSAAQFKGFQQGVEAKDFRGGDVLVAAQELIDFQAATENGVELGTIRSIIPPMFADHIRRESLKFCDELKRAGYRT
jgi:hypothetical protein